MAFVVAPSASALGWTYSEMRIKEVSRYKSERTIYSN